jgi:plasmid stability protein
MADILIDGVDEATIGLLKLRAARRGESLEAHLREILRKLAREDDQASDDAVPLGDWLVAISRPGVDLHDALEAFRSRPVREKPE